MKQNKKKYVSPSMETMNCKIEQGYQCSGCNGSTLEGLIEGGNANDLLN